MFPQLIAGPIVRYKDIEESLKNGGLYKHKKSKEVGVLDKVEGTPEHVLIYNHDIRGKKIGELENIDYEWYVAEAQKRIDDFLGIKRKPVKKKKSEKNL